MTQKTTQYFRNHFNPENPENCKALSSWVSTSFYDKNVCILSNKTEQDLLFYISVVFPKIKVCVKIQPIT